MTAQIIPFPSAPAFTVHRTVVRRHHAGFEAACSCGWSFQSPSKIECELRASTHDLDEDAA